MVTYLSPCLSFLKRKGSYVQRVTQPMWSRVDLISSSWAPSLSSQTLASWQRTGSGTDTYAVIWPMRPRGSFYWGFLRTFLFAYLGKSLGGFSLFYTIPIRKNATITILWHFRMKVALWTAEWRHGWWFYRWSFESANLPYLCIPSPIFVLPVKQTIKKFHFSKGNFVL